MASPAKPWEKPPCCRQSDEGPPPSFMSSGPAGSLGGSIPGPSAAPAIGGGDAPPIPTRPSLQSGYSSYMPNYGGYSSPYSSYGGMYSSPYSTGMYGGYGSFGGYGYNRLGYGQGDSYSSFARQAEESSRPAFQSIESIVGAFSSVSMMLDSTFQAVYNSFRAVIGVADNFSRMKMQFAQIFSAFALFRTIRYLYRKLLVLLRLRPRGFAEDAWTEAGDAVQVAEASRPGGGKSSWPVLMFFAIIMGGPWLIWKFLSKTFGSMGIAPGWATGVEDHFVAQAKYDFTGQGNDELTFKAGQNINVAPKEMQPRVKDWLLACVDGKTVGLIPANYVKVLGKRRGTAASQNQMLENTQHVQNIPNPVNTQTGSQALQPEEFLSDRTTEQFSSQGSGETQVPNAQSFSQVAGETSVPNKECCSKNKLEFPNTTQSEQCCNKGLTQTASAVNLENQAREGFMGDNSNLDSILPEDDEQR